MKKPPKNNRIPRIQELLRQELGNILLRQVEAPDGALITLTRVVASGNLQEAKVYISVMPDEKSKETLKILEEHIYDIQQTLNQRLKMRPVPKIIWMLESAGAEAQKIEGLLDQIRKEVK